MTSTNRERLATLESALREYELAHRVWMATTIHDPAKRKAAKLALAEKREAYIAAYKAVHPSHIVM